MSTTNPPVRDSIKWHTAFQSQLNLRIIYTSQCVLCVVSRRSSSFAIRFSRTFWMVKLAELVWIVSGPWKFDRARRYVRLQLLGDFRWFQLSENQTPMNKYNCVFNLMVIPPHVETTNGGTTMIYRCILCAFETNSCDLFMVSVEHGAIERARPNSAVYIESCIND